MHPSHTIPVRGVPIRYLASGQAGSPVILLHGGGIDSALLSWGAAIPALSADHRVYAPDLPGYGGSGDANAPYSIEYYIDIVRSWMDALRLDAASLAGVSMGGSIALGLALSSPERVSRLVLVDSYGLAEKAPWPFLSWLFVRTPGLNALTWTLVRRSKRMTRWSLMNVMHDVSRTPEELVDAVFADVQSPRAGKAFESFQRHELQLKGLRTVYLPRLSEIRAPTLVVHGAHDKLVPVAAAKEAARRIPDAKLHILADCGHWPQRERPDEFNRVVSEFLAE